MIQAVVVTRFFRLEGSIHFPNLGKEGRRLSNMLNSERRFIAMTDVSICDRMSGVKDPKVYPFIEISVEAIEFIQPCGDDPEEARVFSESNHPSAS
jgi:hypothetical protein